MKFGLNENIIDQINAVFRKHSEITEVYVYGSRGKNTYRVDSDIDLLINSTPNQEILHTIKQELNALNLEYEIDIKFYDDLKDLEFRRKVESYAQIFYNLAI